jgi:hypothetical protein
MRMKLMKSKTRKMMETYRRLATWIKGMNFGNFNLLLIATSTSLYLSLQIDRQVYKALCQESVNINSKKAPKAAWV